MSGSASRSVAELAQNSDYACDPTRSRCHQEPIVIGVRIARVRDRRWRTVMIVGHGGRAISAVLRVCDETALGCTVARNRLICVSSFAAWRYATPLPSEGRRVSFDEIAPIIPADCVAG